MKKTLALITATVSLLAVLCSCGKTEEKVVTVAATAAPHAEILEYVKEDLKAEGYTLEVKVMDDYVIPNKATEDGEVDANFFQHVPYLDSFNKENGTHLVSIAQIHYEPLGLYGGKSNDLKAISDGATIAVPNDTTNEARALLLLEANGIIKLKEGAGLTATKKDIEENPYNVEINEMDAALVPGILSDVDFGVINGNYAIGAGLKVADALAKEEASSDAAQTYANVIVVKEGNEENEGVQALIKVLKTDKVKKFIEEKYAGAVVAIF